MRLLIALLIVSISKTQFAINVQHYNFGNYYLALTNALWAARFCNATCVVVQTQPNVVFQATVQTTFAPSQLRLVVASLYYAQLNKFIESPAPTMRDRLRVTCAIDEPVRRSVLGLAPSVTEKFTTPDTLVAHIRSGDIFTTSIHERYWQPPLGFYQLAAREFKRVAVCSQSYDNPTVRALFNWCVRTRGADNCLLRVGQPLLPDIAFLLAARNMAVGSGSFGVGIYALSAMLRRVYYVDGYFTAAVATTNTETRCSARAQVDGVKIAYNMSQVTENAPWHASTKQANALLLDERQLDGLRVEKIIKLL